PTTIAAAFAALCRTALPVRRAAAITPAGRPLRRMGNARVGDLARAIAPLRRRQPLDADERIPAALEQPALRPLVEHGELDLVAAGAELGERRPKGVVDGFAACFGLVHWQSSIHEQVRAPASSSNPTRPAPPRPGSSVSSAARS